jgi:hypothetical protein
VRNGAVQTSVHGGSTRLSERLGGRNHASESQTYITCNFGRNFTPNRQPALGRPGQPFVLCLTSRGLVFLRRFPFPHSCFFTARLRLSPQPAFFRFAVGRTAAPPSRGVRTAKSHHGAINAKRALDCRPVPKCDGARHGRRIHFDCFGHHPTRATAGCSPMGLLAPESQPRCCRPALFIRFRPGLPWLVRHVRAGDGRGPFAAWQPLLWHVPLGHRFLLLSL